VKWRPRVRVDMRKLADQMAADLLADAQRQLPGEWLPYLRDPLPRGVDNEQPNWLVGNCPEQGRRDAQGRWWFCSPWIGWRLADSKPYLARDTDS
jgi:hypothetical protein